MISSSSAPPASLVFAMLLGGEVCTGQLVMLADNALAGGCQESIRVLGSGLPLLPFQSARGL
ncbi:MAG: hypothetical protein R3F53_14710 [Gammaproteobacteria bacterium]